MKSFVLTSPTGLVTRYTVVKNRVGVISDRGVRQIMSIEDARVHYSQTRKLYTTSVPVSLDNLSEFINNIGR